MATKMELVLSPSGAGNGAGSGYGEEGGPFRNEDVREWSRVDRITGMLERARVETGRWRADTDDARQSYGKVIDSRERNSADGSLVQKARRQVEIFQSQANSGRSFQVVRASQWSSSKATDCGFNIPITSKPSNTQYMEDAMNGETSRLFPARLDLAWRSSLDTESELDQLSCLCRKLHNEAINQHNKLWSMHTSGARSPSPLLDSPASEVLELSERLSNGERRSNSSEDLSSLPNLEDAFARDCKTRRSLQISQSSEHATSEELASKTRRSRNDFIAERARRFEEGIDEKPGVKRNFISTKSFTSIADNDFVKNDPKHPSKFSQVAKVQVQDNAQNSQTVRVASPLMPRRAAEPVTTTRKANNKTVVHLRNVASPTGESSEPPLRCINVTAIKLEKDAEPQIESHSKENGLYSMLADSTTKEDPATTTTTTTTPLVNGVKPVKKVEFCKTEIHFAPDSGKVNIVETDGKPPPTNKFRRRRRNNSLGAASNNNTQKSNMPLVHFGDTSYEKYIFGGGKLPLHETNKTAELTDNLMAEENHKKYNSAIAEIKRDRWDSPEKVREDETAGKELTMIKDSYVDSNLEKVVDHNIKNKGTHTTTVNFLNDENRTVPKISEGVRNSRGIRLQFAASNRSLSPLNSDDESLVSRTTKITVHLPPAAISQHPRALLQSSAFSNLKSVRLVMSIGQTSASGPSLKQLFSSLYDPVDGLSLNEDSSPQLWSLQLKSTDDDGLEEPDVQSDKRQVLDSSRMITDKVISSFPSRSHVSEKEIDTERLPSRSQLLSKDSDDNQVLLKIVTTHKPMVARVDSDPLYPLKSRSKAQSSPEIPKDENLVKERENSQEADLKAKEHCDTSNDTSDSPTYENIFDAVSSDGVPVYENFQVVSSKTSPLMKEKRIEKPAPKKSVQERSLHKKIGPKLSNGSVEAAPSKAKVKSAPRSATPMSSLKSPATDNAEPKRANRTSSRSSGSRDNSIKRYKDGKLVKDDSARINQAKRRNSTKSESAAQEHKNTLSSTSSDKKGGSLRAEKPVEVVYQTAVYNMKNEKLSKPKAKEIKGPRLINDLICGSKMKRPADNKRVIKTAIASQNTSKRKELPVTLNR